MKTDGQLLRKYAEDGDESAFRELVERHIGLVHSTALRNLGWDFHLAHDVTQIVFNDLAAKAQSLQSNEGLSGWLYRRSFFVASSTVRSERRRRAREEEAMSMHYSESDDQPNWKQVAPVLDEAINQLEEKDRDAIVLRFFKKMDFRSIAETIGATEEAAQKRVSRAVEKMRPILASKGFSLSSGAVLAVLGGISHSAPAGLAASIATVSLATAAGAQAGILTAITTMTLTKLKIGIASAVILGSFVPPLVIQRQAIEDLRARNAALEKQAAQIPELKEAASKAARIMLDYGELERLRSHQSELMRLRGEMGVLRRERNELRAALNSGGNVDKNTEAPADDKHAAQPEDWNKTGKFLDKTLLNYVGQETPAHAMQTYLWSLLQPDRDLFITNIVSGIDPEKLSRAASEFTSSFGDAKGLVFDGSVLDETKGQARLLVSVLAADGRESIKRIALERGEDRYWRVVSDEWTVVKAFTSGGRAAEPAAE